MLPELSREMPVPKSELPPPKCVVVFVVELINDTNTCESKLSALESTPVTFVVIMFVGKFLDCVKPAINAVPLASTPQELSTLLKNDTEKWGRLIKAKKITSQG